MINIVDTQQIVRAVAQPLFGDDPGRPLLDQGRVIGSLHENEAASYCFLDEILPGDPAATRPEQTVDIFTTIERALHSAGFEFSNLVRTWFYLDNILDWYDDFNQARTPFLQARGAFEGLVPASTGIGIRNRFGSAVVAGALAVKPKTTAGQIVAVPSPLQGSALEYKSSFSRAVEVAQGGRKELYISGTASIDREGNTVFRNDTRNQIKLTMEVVEAILQSRGMDWSDCTRAIAYFKDAKDAPLFQQYLEQNALEALPVTLLHADICRDDLLFELELDAVV